MSIETSNEINHIAAALHSVEGMVERVKRDSTNPHFRNRYASLEAVIDAARPALQACGITFTQAPGRMIDGCLEITTMLIHTSGQWMRSTMHVPIAKRDPQGVGSATTYGCRYSLMAMLGLPPTDDDGEAARVPDEPETPIKITSGVARPSAHQARKNGQWTPLVEALRACKTEEALQKWHDDHEAEIEQLPEGWIADLRDEYSAQAYAIKKGR